MNPSGVIDVGELEGLMHRARRRVVDLWWMLAAVITAISLPVLWLPMSGALIAKSALWSLASGALLWGVRWWIQGRIAATQRLLALVRAGDLEITFIDTIKVSLELLPFGYEVDVHLRSGDSLAFGFWRGEAAEQLRRVLEPYVVGRARRA